MLQVHPALIIAFVVVFVTAIYLVFFEGHEDTDWTDLCRRRK